MYTVLLVITAAVMVLLPLMYLAVVCGAGYFLKWYAVNGLQYTHMTSGSRFGSRGASRLLVLEFLVIYVTPLLAIGSVFLFLLKPLLARPSKQLPPLDIPPNEEPWLFEFVYAVCDKIGAPRPKSIVVNADVNASASFRRGLISLLLPGDLVLTIGMPLVMGLTLRQFAGVLAHEFGHFRQRIAMRATMIIRLVALWFASRAWDRDTWDDMLDRWREEFPYFLVQIMVMIAQLCVWIARIVLLVLAYFAMGLSAALLRQMEFSADRYEARLCGSEEWVATMRRILELGAAQGIAMSQAKEMYQQRKEVPEDLASLIAAASRRLVPNDRMAIEAAMTETKCSWFESHPAPGARAAAVIKQAEPGLFASELPATAIFMNVRQVSRNASHGLYMQLLGHGMLATTMVQTGELLAGHQEAERKESLADSFLGFTPPLWRPFGPRLGEPLPPADAKAALREWRAAVQRMQSLPNLADAAREFATADEQLSKCERASVMLQFKLGAPGRALGIAAATPQGVTAARNAARDRAAENAAILDDRIELAAKRVANVFKLLATPSLCKRIPDGERLLARAKVLTAAVRVLSDQGSMVREMRVGIDGLVELVKGAEKNETKFKELKPAMKERIGNVRRAIQSIEDGLNAVADPRDDADSMLSSAFGARITGGAAARSSDTQVLHAAMTTMDRFISEQREYGGELIDIAVRVERAINDMERAAAVQSAKGQADAKR